MSDADANLLSINRQLEVFLESLDTLLLGAASSGDVSISEINDIGVAAIADLMVQRSEEGKSVDLSDAADVLLLIEASIAASNAAGLTQDLRASDSTNLSAISQVIASYNALIDTATHDNTQTEEALAALRAAQSLLLPVLQDVGQAKQHWQRQWKYALLVGAISPVSYVMVLYALQIAPLSHVAPAREVSMLFAALLGGHLLGEGDRLARLCGAACIGLGVVALALG